jgi:hypothetical protein
MWFFSTVKNIVTPTPITPTPTLIRQVQTLPPGWQTFSDGIISFHYPQGYKAAMRGELYYAVYKDERTTTGEASVFIDLRRQIPLNNYDAAIAAKRKQLQFISEQSYKNGIQLSGQIAEGLGKGLPYIVTFLPYDAGAVSIETSGERINTAVYQGVLNSLDVSKSPTTLNIPVAITRARNDLAEKLSVRPTEIQIQSSEPAEWNNSGLGCEDPGEMTLQVITPGYRVEFSYNGKAYIYHTDQTDSFRACNK